MPTIMMLMIFGFTHALAPAAQRAGEGAASAAPLVVTADWLTQNLNNPYLVLLHVGEKADFDPGHIPGARLISLSDVATPLSADPMLELLPPAQLREAFEKLGVSDNSRIVVYFSKDLIQAAARVLLTLDYMGLGSQASMLDGGMPAWRAAGHALTTDMRTPARGKLSLKVRDDVVVDLAGVRSLVGQSGVVLVDARLPNYYRGESAGKASRPGRIPGAVNLPYTSVFDDSLKIKGKDALEALFRDAGVKPGVKVVAYCHVGQTASLVYLVARQLGFEARLYDGSYTEWSSKPENAVEK